MNPSANYMQKLYAPLRNAVKGSVYSLMRALPLRQRYVWTKAGRLRLRYVAPVVTVCAVTFVYGASAYVSDFVMNSKSGFEISSADGRSAEDDLSASQRRLARYRDETTQTLAGAYVPEKKEEPQPREKIVKIGKGDTLAAVLQKTGLGAGQAYTMIEALSDHYDPRKIKIGQEIKVRFDPDESGEYHFAHMDIAIDPIKTVRLDNGADNSYVASVHEKDVAPVTYTGSADIEVSLYGSAQKAGIPASVIAQTMHIYSWDVDFQRDIRKGDMIEVMYEQLETPEGIRVKSGDVIYARLNVNGQDIPVYRFEKDNGDVDYYTADGTSLRKALMQTPIDGARLSSGFGLRKHPVLGYNKMHKGVDFAAARGTPIYAAGDGTIEKAGPYSSYGNYVRIRHNSSLKTAYAHMKGFAKGITAGSRVKQGQVIGYVGTTGRSTGPHLHYEVLMNNKQVNPKSVDLPQGETLKGAVLASFKSHVKKLDRQYASLSGKQKLASKTANSKTTVR